MEQKVSSPHISGTHLIAPKLRNSSVEVLRIIAMAMVLLTHWNWSFLGAHLMLDKPEDIGAIRIFIESILIICVNLFLLITGYYGIKFRIRTILNIGILVISVFLLQSFWIIIWTRNVDIADILRCFLFISNSDYFVVDYLFLMFLSPILNCFISTFEKQILPYVLFLFLVEVYFGCIRENSYFFINHGYGIIHFLVMYLISRCLFLYKDLLERISQMKWLTIFVICITINFLSGYQGRNFTWYYCNPIVVIESISFFMLFANRCYYNKHINWIASGTFSVYILHRYNPIHDILKNIDIHLYTTESYGMYLIYSLPILVFFYFTAICYDKFLDILRKPFLGFCDSLQMKYLMKNGIFN